MAAIRNLVFEGCGVKGLAYLGALEVLTNRGVLSGVQRVAGTSAGAIVAGLLATGADSKTLSDKLKPEELARLLGGIPGFGDVINSAFTYGLHSGEPIEAWVRDQIAEQTRSRLGEARPDLTFGDLQHLALEHPGTFRQPYVIVTNLSEQRPQVFCAETSPDVTIAHAVRLSASIPGIVQVTKHGGALMIDGGLTWNYPFQLFGGAHRAPIPPKVQQALLQQGSPEETLGFVTLSRVDLGLDDGLSPVTNVASASDYINAIFSLTTKAATSAHVDDIAASRTVFIDCEGLSPIDFRIPAEARARLVDQGRKATAAWLDAIA
ncbi:MAG: patatin-like phospholipase family protein [Myxococcota bacterium]